MAAIRRVTGKIRSSRLYHKLFVAQIDHERVEEMKREMMLKYYKGWF